MSIRNLSDHAAVAIGLSAAADRYNADPASDVVNLKKYGHLTAILDEGAGGTGTVKIQVEECTALDGTGATAIAFKYRVGNGALTASAAAGYTTVAGANKQIVVEVDERDLSVGSAFARIQLTEVVDSPCVAALIFVLTHPRTAKGTAESPIT